MLIICYNNTNLNEKKKTLNILLEYGKSDLPENYNFNIYNTIHTIDNVSGVDHIMTYHGLFPNYLNDINETKKYNTICFFFCSTIKKEEIIDGVNKYLNISGKVIFGLGLNSNKKDVVKILIDNYNYKKIKQGKYQNKKIIDDETKLDSILYDAPFIFILQKLSS